MLPKSVHANRIEENKHSKPQSSIFLAEVCLLITIEVTRIPEDLFDELEKAAAAHPPQRVVNPSKGWGLDFDIFDD